MKIHWIYETTVVAEVVFDLKSIVVSTEVFLFILLQ